MIAPPTLTQPPPQQTSVPTRAVQPVYTLTDDDRARAKAIAFAWKAYEGCLDKPLVPLPGDPDDNVLSNRCQQIVDRGVDFLFGKELEIALADAAPDTAQSLIDTAWGRKETRIPLLQDLAMNGAMAGRAFLRIMPNKDATKFRLITVDPAIVSVQHAPQDCETVLLYHLEYSVKEPINGTPQTVCYCEEIARVDPDGNARRGQPDDDDTWMVNHWTRLGERGDWTPDAGGAYAWPYPFAPLFSCKNLPKPNSFWGMPDLTNDLIGLNIALNLVQSNINRTEKLYGNPILYSNGEGEGVLDVKPGRIAALSETGKITAVPIPTDVANALAFAANLRSDIDEQSAVPGVATGRISDMPRGNLSGIAIELLFMPITKKTDKKRNLYGELLIDVTNALLVLGGIDADIDMTLAWQSPLPHDDLPSVQSAIAKKELSISNTTLQRELGYDPEEELALSQSEQEQQLVAYSRGAGLPPAVPGVPPLPEQTPQPPAAAPGADVPPQGGQT